MSFYYCFTHYILCVGYTLCMFACDSQWQKPFIMQLLSLPSVCSGSHWIWLHMILAWQQVNALTFEQLLHISGNTHVHTQVDNYLHWQCHGHYTNNKTWHEAYCKAKPCVLEHFKTMQYFYISVFVYLLQRTQTWRHLPVSHKELLQPHQWVSPGP